MAINKDNNIFNKTSFLGNNSSEFVENLYAEYLNNPSKLPEEWRKFFEGLNEQKDKILQNANGPSWSPKKKVKIIEPGIIDSENNKNGGLETHSPNLNLLDSAKTL